MKNTRILWSGLTGKTGLAALKVVRDIPDVEIVAGMKRRSTTLDNLWLYDEPLENMDWINYETGLWGFIRLNSADKTNGYRRNCRFFASRRI